MATAQAHLVKKTGDDGRADAGRSKGGWGPKGKVTQRRESA